MGVCVPRPFLLGNRVFFTRNALWLLYNILFLSLGIEYVPLLDIGFALSATSPSYAAANFEKMKSVIHSIIDQYSIDRVKYGLVVYGDDAEISFDFQRSFPKDEDLYRYLSIATPAEGGSNLEEGLKKGQELFTGGGTRPDAQKVLVVFTDHTFRGDAKKAETVTRELKGNGIKVIAIGLGRESDRKELGGVASNRRHVIPAKRTDSSEELAKEVIALGLEGMYWLVWSEAH